MKVIGIIAKVIRIIVAVLYILAVFVIVICTPISAIMLLCKACGASALSWLASCVPLMIAIAASPIVIIGKIIIEK